MKNRDMQALQQSESLPHIESFYDIQYSHMPKLFRYVEQQTQKFRNSPEYTEANLHRARHVYVIYSKNTGLYKIGRSVDLKERLMQLRAQSGCEIVFLFAVRIETFDTCYKVFEASIHEFYCKKRIAGEWFNLDKNDLSDIYETFLSSDTDDLIENELQVLQLHLSERDED